MQRKTFLSIASSIALLVGSIAIAFPAQFLASKGTVPSAAADLWMRETGILLFCIGVIAWRMRDHPDSASMKAFFTGIVFVQLGLAISEWIAYAQGVITVLSGVPPTLMNLCLAWGFYHYASRISVR